MYKCKLSYSWLQCVHTQYDRIDRAYHPSIHIPLLSKHINRLCEVIYSLKPSSDKEYI